MKHDDLLTPTLGQTTTQAIYSPGAMVAAAFFGGAFAVPLLAMESSRRLGRLPRDLVWALLGLAAAIVIVLGLLFHYHPVLDDEVRRNVRFGNRAMGFVLAGGYYLLHRSTFRTMKTMGIDAPSPYVPVIVTVLISYALTVGLTGVWISTLAPGISQ